MAALPAAPSPRGLDRLILFLWALLVGAAVVPVILVGAIAWRSYGIALGEAETLVRKTVDILHEHKVKTLETEELILDEIAGRIAGRDWDEISASPEITGLLKRLAAGKEQIAAIWLIDGTGRVRASNIAWAPDVNGSDRDYFQAQIAADVGTYVGKAYTGRSTGKSSFSISRRRTAPDGSFDGIIAISLSADYLREFAARVSPEPDHASALFRADGEVLMRERPGPTQTSPDDPLMRAIRQRDDGVLWRRSVIDGAEHLMAYRKLAGYPLYVTYGMSKATVLAPWRESLIFAGLLIGGCGVALFLVTLLALRRAMRERAAIVRLEEEMAQRELAEKALRQAQKIEALGQLTSGVAHDFNNLLTVIAGNLDILRGRPAPVRAGRCIADALSATERSRNLVASLLAFARQQPLDAKIFDLNQRLVELKPLLLHTLPSTVELVLDTEAEPVLVDTDVNQTEMTVLNLVVNARDAMPRGGRIRVAASQVDLCSEPGGLTGAFAALSVSDTGEGMPPEVLEKAFEPFFTTKAAGKGTGLGLSMVHKFALQSAGGATIRSRVGEGTEVVVYLPLAER